MIYCICNEQDEVILEVKNLDKGIELLKALDDGEIRPYAEGFFGYYTDHYCLEEKNSSAVYTGDAEFVFNEGAAIKSIPSSVLSHLIFTSNRSETELLVTSNAEKARKLFDELSPDPVVFDKETRTIKVPFICFETEDTGVGDTEVIYKCQAFEFEN